MMDTRRAGLSSWIVQCAVVVACVLLTLQTSSCSAMYVNSDRAKRSADSHHSPGRPTGVCYDE